MKQLAPVEALATEEQMRGLYGDAIPAGFGLGQDLHLKITNHLHQRASQSNQADQEQVDRSVTRVTTADGYEVIAIGDGYFNLRLSDGSLKMNEFDHKTPYAYQGILDALVFGYLQIVDPQKSSEEEDNE